MYAKIICKSQSQTKKKHPIFHYNFFFDRTYLKLFFNVHALDQYFDKQGSSTILLFVHKTFLWIFLETWLT